MRESEEENMIPSNSEGIKTDTEASVTLENEEAAIQHFQTVKGRLLNISKWRDISAIGPSDFQLVDGEGNEVWRPAQEGDFFKIDIPGPGSDEGDGFDWVRIISIKEEQVPKKHMEMISIEVHPAPNPKELNRDVSHFFKKETSSTFLVKREACIISAAVHGRNESPNTETENFTDKIRNAVVAVGAMLGFSKVQWKSLTEGLVNTNT